jgi:diadenosine tetraphosphate (Ap4A) HIT family hydrolase
MTGDAGGGAAMAGCAFCTPGAVETILTETPHLRLVADFAPLVEGHVLILPRSHYPCYGTVPLAYEPELVALKRRVARFFRKTYRPAVFFEHGVFRQTVFHAHLHAFPFGGVGLSIADLALPDGQPVHGLADLHAWYATHGHYFYLESPRAPSEPLEARVFPPEEDRYYRALGALRQQSGVVGGWRPASERRASAAPVIAALAEAWHAFERAHPAVKDSPATASDDASPDGGDDARAALNAARRADGGMVRGLRPSASRDP